MKIAETLQKMNVSPRGAAWIALGGAVVIAYLYHNGLPGDGRSETESGDKPAGEEITVKRDWEGARHDIPAGTKVYKDFDSLEPCDTTSEDVARTQQKHTEGAPEQRGLFKELPVEGCGFGGAGWIVLQAAGTEAPRG